MTISTTFRQWVVGKSAGTSSEEIAAARNCVLDTKINGVLKLWHHNSAILSQLLLRTVTNIIKLICHSDDYHHTTLPRNRTAPKPRHVLTCTASVLTKIDAFMSRSGTVRRSKISRASDGNGVDKLEAVPKLCYIIKLLLLSLEAADNIPRLALNKAS